MQPNDQVWQRAIVVGASSGIGEAISRALAARGVHVALIARRLPQLEAIAADIHAVYGQECAVAFQHDVQDHAQAASILQEAAAHLGGLDLVVYAAGIMPNIPKNEYPTVTDVTTIETNFTGAVAWLNAAADRFARTGSGAIIGISSVAGDRGRHGNVVYSATKAALDMYLASLRARLARHGVVVLTAKPGYVQTELLSGLKTPFYLPAVTPQQAAFEILEAAKKGRRVAYVPGWWRIVMAVIRAIPSPIFERLNI